MVMCILRRWLAAPPSACSEMPGCECERVCVCTCVCFALSSTTYCRPTFKCVVKRLRFHVFKEIANSIIAFWARLESGGGGGGGGGGGFAFAFAFIASSHLNVGLQYYTCKLQICFPLTGSREWEYIPVLAASEMIATSFLPSINEARCDRKNLIWLHHNDVIQGL